MSDTANLVQKLRGDPSLLADHLLKEAGREATEREGCEGSGPTATRASWEAVDALSGFFRRLGDAWAPQKLKDAWKREEMLERTAIRWADEASVSGVLSSLIHKTPNNWEKIEDAQASGPPRAVIPSLPAVEDTSLTPANVALRSTPCVFSSLENVNPYTSSKRSYHPPDMLWTGVLGELCIDERAQKYQSKDKLDLAKAEFREAQRWLKIAKYLHSRTFRASSLGDCVRSVQLEASVGLVADKKAWLKRRKRLMKLETFGFMSPSDRRLAEVKARTLWSFSFIEWCDKKFAGAEYGAAKVMLDSLSKREKKFLKRLKKIAELEQSARKLQTKANRQATCDLFSRRWDGSICLQPQGYRHWHCKNRYCPTCAPRSFLVLLNEYLPLEVFCNDWIRSHPNYRLRILDITSRKPPGGRMPTNKENRLFGAQVHELYRRIEEYLAEGEIPTFRERVKKSFCRIEQFYKVPEVRIFGEQAKELFGQMEKSCTVRKIRALGKQLKKSFHQIKEFCEVRCGEQIEKLLHSIEKFCEARCGYLYCKEFGRRNQNLHCHGLLLSPYVPQERLSLWWSQIRPDRSFVVWIGQARSMRKGETPFVSGLKHAFEYTGKYATSGWKTSCPAERASELELPDLSECEEKDLPRLEDLDLRSKENLFPGSAAEPGLGDVLHLPDGTFCVQRALELEVAFHRTRRVNTLGLFYDRLPDDDDQISEAKPCPCGREGCYLKPSTKLDPSTNSDWFLTHDLELQGLRNLDADEMVAHAARAPC